MSGDHCWPGPDPTAVAGDISACSTAALAWSARNAVAHWRTEQRLGRGEVFHHDVLTTAVVAPVNSAYLLVSTLPEAAHETN